ncbi:MAG: malto-oligosyltrehalose trehalohydrolase [Nitrospirae bacterium]|nr:malto-oligosyltrehalose trehalohydrolase [Nitrospirota bacterium]
MSGPRHPGIAPALVPEAARLGPTYLGDGRCEFLVWAPVCETVSLKLLDQTERIIPMGKCDKGYWHALVEEVFPGTRYFYDLGSRGVRPDPASRFQPEGVHGPSAIEDHRSFMWQDDKWRGIPLTDYIIYELHVGVFTQSGTFEAIIPLLDYLCGLGVTAIELMPVSQFPEARNWGYDGAYTFAPQNSYGGPGGLKSLVNECHLRGLAVILDVVYNHFGPEGSYLGSFGPYFTDRYKTPWGDAVNFDGPCSDEVRRFFIESALYWISEFRIDALRIDAIHGIYDFSAKPFLLKLSESVHGYAEKNDRKIYVIAESDLNDSRAVSPPESGGLGLDCQWNEDFHHSLHALLTGEKTGYYADFGRIEDMEKALKEGFVYGDRYSVHRKRSHGNSSEKVPAHRLVVFSQNHDQVGNRAMGDRLSSSLSFEKLKLAAGVVLLSPFIPLLFMGEEYAETAPFHYFISHSEQALIQAVREGRKQEFPSFAWGDEPPDPQSAETFLRSKLNLDLRAKGTHKTLFTFYKKMLALRRTLPPLRNLSKQEMEVMSHAEGQLFVRRWFESDEVFCLFNFSSGHATIQVLVGQGPWRLAIDSSSSSWEGPGSSSGEFMITNGASVTMNPNSFVVYSKTTLEETSS